jgi:hypothetical protein
MKITLSNGEKISNDMLRHLARKLDKSGKISIIEFLETFCYDDCDDVADALAEHMTESVGAWREAQKAVPIPVPEPPPAPKSKLERKIEKLEKKYQSELDTECQGPGRCALEGGRCGQFLPGRGCQPLPGERQVYDPKAAAVQALSGISEPSVVKETVTGNSASKDALGGGQASDDGDLLKRITKLESTLSTKGMAGGKHTLALQFL